jgi:hypothetical protein
MALFSPQRIGTGRTSEEVMKNRLFLIAASFFLFAAVASPTWAQAIYPTVKLTVMQPVVIPGHVLEPGQYYVANLDYGDEVWIHTADDSQSFFESVGNASRQQPANGVVVDVARQKTGLPRILDYFYPGDTYGTAFLYPVHPRVRMAKLVGPPPARNLQG